MLLSSEWEELAGPFESVSEAEAYIEDPPWDLEWLRTVPMRVYVDETRAVFVQSEVIRVP